MKKIVTNKQIFFDLKKLWKDYKICPDDLKAKAYFITGVRNCGKSYSAWKYAVDNSLTPDKKLIYLRHKETATKNFKVEFNNKYKDKFHMTDTHIFNMKYDEEFNKYTKDQLVGFVATINTYEKSKSLAYENVNLIIFDEFNVKSDILDVYWKFINLLTSFIRHNKNVVLIALANRDNENDPFSVALGINDYVPNKEDQVQEVLNESEVSIYWIELGTKWNGLVKNDNTLFFKLAQFDKKTMDYLTGEYAIKKPFTVINYEKNMKDTFVPLWGFWFDQQLYYYGEFIHPKLNVKKLAIVSAYNYGKIVESVNCYIFDCKSKYMKLSLNLDDEEILELVELIIYQLKEENLYFDSFNMKTIFDKFIIR